MTEKELQELDFEKVVVTIEESGNKNDYYYYKYDLNENCVLMSNESDEVVGNRWYVYEYDMGIKIDSADDVDLLISLFGKWSKTI